MRTAVLLCVLVLLAGVMLTPSEAPVVDDDGPVITRATAEPAAGRFELDDGRAVTLDRRALVSGSGFLGTTRGPFVRFEREGAETLQAEVVILHDEGLIEAWPPAGTRGTWTLVVENPDATRASATVAF